MKVCAAQFRPIAGDFETNRAKHLELIELAVTQGADVLFFPELSLTGFEPRLADSLAIEVSDHRLDPFQKYSDKHNLIIGVGMPIIADSDVYIGMVWFAPGEARRLYAKQQLHPDEHPYFVPGREQLLLERQGFKLTPAICYESLKMDHANEAAALFSDMYLASVAKSVGGVAKAMKHYPIVARSHNIFVIMANCVGPSDDFISVGQSAAWNIRGELLAQIDAESEGVVVLDTHSGSASVKKLDNQAMHATGA
ncbi:carbon-nitrogen hydrolase family protein [Halomonas urumqiensis]|uniref:Carbon-nitrogen hydrolase family protein n=1 Tax=Halomonas urumqiensis TaxID=1684789 RepID=A0A2N7UQP7_9GAMM|nr:carbon-nitrogen hydrolase family protein [Halomonas urumqiensis]PMR82754.1 carbon-nitrogen hydrolase family protein [Halomonas urumqiensis]PTB01927.1 carbon-nitrogen hydrolase family protein [Halomonas urumqiensis]GHE22034.1 hydrolase [Halomonas urumqiensis]